MGWLSVPVGRGSCPLAGPSGSPRGAADGQSGASRAGPRAGVEPVIGPGRQEASTGALRRSKQRPRARAGRWGRRWDSPAPSQGWASRSSTRRDRRAETRKGVTGCLGPGPGHSGRVQGSLWMSNVDCGEEHATLWP